MRIRHAFTGQVYELVADGRVRVTDPATGEEGVFDALGRWQEGALRHADLHMCGAVAGPKAAPPRPAEPTPS